MVIVVATVLCPSIVRGIRDQFPWLKQALNICEERMSTMKWAERLRWRSGDLPEEQE